LHPPASIVEGHNLALAGSFDAAINCGQRRCVLFIEDGGGFIEVPLLDLSHTSTVAGMLKRRNAVRQRAARFLVGLF
jgi:hypothetical protein